MGTILKIEPGVYTTLDRKTLKPKKDRFTVEPDGTWTAKRFFSSNTEWSGDKVTFGTTELWVLPFSRMYVLIPLDKAKEVT